MNTDKPSIPSAKKLINYGLNKVGLLSPVSPVENIRAHVEVIRVKKVKRFTGNYGINYC